MNEPSRKVAFKLGFYVKPDTSKMNMTADDKTDWLTASAGIGGFLYVDAIINLLKAAFGA